MLGARPSVPTYDVVVIGGALSGASTAILLLEESPALKVLIVEKSVAFSRRVGEATIEVSTYFLRNCLGLSQHLHQEHLVKNGLRFWFSRENTSTLGECSEIGGRYLSRLPAYLVDRAVMDEAALKRAMTLGAKVLRPATVHEVQLQEGGIQSLTVRCGDGHETISARWVVDASGFAASLARKNGWWQSNPSHPTTAVWARWTGVKDFDAPEVRRRFPECAKRCHGIRNSATNHLTGDGWWAWWIPLKNGDVSIGVVFDERFVQWPEEGSLGERLKRFLLAHPVAKELMSEAKWREGDVHWRKHLPYCSSKFFGDGFALVGDAAAFLDPLYSPGMDWIAYTTTAAAKLVLTQQNGKPVSPLVEQLNGDFTRSYRRWFDAIYRDKYAYIGEFDLMKLAFVMDVGLYYLGVASQPFFRGPTALCEPYFSTTPSTPFFYWMRAYNRRFASIACARRHRGVLGRSNEGKFLLVKGFAFEPGSVWAVTKAASRWICLEFTEGWRTWFRSVSLSKHGPLVVGQKRPPKLTENESDEKSRHLVVGNRTTPQCSAAVSEQIPSPKVSNSDDGRDLLAMD